MANLNPQYPTKSQSSPIIQTSPNILEKPFKIRTKNRKAPTSKSVKHFEMQKETTEDDLSKDLESKIEQEIA